MIKIFSVNSFSVKELVKLINSETDGKEIESITFTKTGVLRGDLEIITREPKSYPVYHEKIVVKEVVSRGLTKSVYTGVRREYESQNWRADIQVKGKRICLGRFSNESKAGMAYDLKAMELRGYETKLNFPEMRDNYKKWLKEGVVNFE